MSKTQATLVRRNAIRRASDTSVQVHHPTPKRMTVHRLEDCPGKESKLAVGPQQRQLWCFSTHTQCPKEGRSRSRKVTSSASSNSITSPNFQSSPKKMSKSAKLKAELLADRFCPLVLDSKFELDDDSSDDESFEFDDHENIDPASKLEYFRRRLEGKIEL
ncbi:hypothetical protein DFH28DRAFT_1177068 [Melampsora americana]|nr:hypothetical protein DFH28DRAFT_1177068 [Melampsora americana]